MSNIVKNHPRQSGVPPGGRGSGLRGPGAPSHSQKSKISKIDRNPRFRPIRSSKMSIYKAIASPFDGRQITLTCSIYLIIQAMTPGNDIFDKTGEIPAVPWTLERPCKNVEAGVTPVTDPQ